MKLTEEEMKILVEVASYHNGMTITKLNPDSMMSVILRLLDFECLTRFQEWHEAEQGLTKELAEKVLAFSKSKGFYEQEVDVNEIPTFWLLNKIL